MDNAVWLFVLAVVSLSLGLTLAYRVKRNPMSFVLAIAGAVVVAAAATGIGFIMSHGVAEPANYVGMTSE